MKNAKKLLALILCAVMALGVLAGCGNDAPGGNSESKPATGNSDKYDVPEIHGTLMLNAGGCVTISFDKDGAVLNIQELDHDGSQLLSDYVGYLQTPCAEVVADLVAIGCQLELLTAEYNDIIIKQLPGGKLPSETFLDDLANAAQEAATLSGSVIVLTEDKLDAEGNILPKAAYDVLQQALQVDKFELVESTEELVEGMYSFNVVAGTLEGAYLVDATYGYVFEGTLDVEDPDLEETDSFEEDLIIPSEEATAPQQDEPLQEGPAE